MVVELKQRENERNPRGYDTRYECIKIGAMFGQCYDYWGMNHRRRCGANDVRGNDDRARWVTDGMKHRGDAAAAARATCPAPRVWLWSAARPGPGATGWRPSWWTPRAGSAGGTGRRSGAAGRTPTGPNRPTPRPAPSTSCSPRVRRRRPRVRRRPSPRTFWAGRTDGRRKRPKTCKQINGLVEDITLVGPDWRNIIYRTHIRILKNVCLYS